MKTPTLPLRMHPVLAALACLSLAAACTPAPEPVAAQPKLQRTDLAAACVGRSGWSDPAPPAHIHGNTWYVGTCGISAILITSEDGHVLIDSGPQSAAPAILESIRAAGFAPGDVKWILTSHEHDDHVGSVAQLAAATGAQVAASARQAGILANGAIAAEDPQFGVSNPYPSVAANRILADGEAVSVGPLEVTMHATPVHTPGSQSWTWTACDGSECRSIAYVDSVTTISADGYRFKDHPERLADIAAGLETVSALSCDILLTPHPGASVMFPRIAGKAPLVEEEACKQYAAVSRTRLEQRLVREQMGTEP